MEVVFRHDNCVPGASLGCLVAFPDERFDGWAVEAVLSPALVGPNIGDVVHAAFCARSVLFVMKYPQHAK